MITNGDLVKTSIALPWILACVVAIGTLVASVSVSVATINMPGDSPYLKDAANATALIFCLVALIGGATGSLILRSAEKKRRLVAWATCGTTVLGAIVTTILMALATT
ncbi:hypothetical protein CQ042_15225 [Microbacterium sp. MYb62]|nr:hypothetical protein CQ042_15225 [Microbacterium sp. MYb62]